MWATEVARVMKPGAHLLAFGGTRTAHRIWCAIEDAGLEVRDTLCWLYGQGFPKSLDVSKATANAKLWTGWGTALKPAHEPICLARRLFAGTVAENVQAHGTGALHIDACRIPMSAEDAHPFGRWPANVVIDEAAGAMVDAQFNGASCFFFCAKAGTAERDAGLRAERGMVGPGRVDGVDTRANVHPTVKPVALMRWLVRLVTPSGGLVLDPFFGSGSTGVACVREGVRCIGIEREPAYVDIALARLRHALTETAA